MNDEKRKDESQDNHQSLKLAAAIAGIIVLVVLAAVVIFFATGSGGKKDTQASSWQEQYDLGMQYLESGDYEQAIVAFTVAIALDSKQAKVYVARGDACVLYSETEEYLTQAESDYQTALELDDTLAAAYYGLANVYIIRGDTDSALEVLNLGLEKTDSDESLLELSEELASQEEADETAGAGQTGENTKNAEEEEDTQDDFSGVLLRTWNTYDTSGTLLNTTTYEYDEEGKLIRTNEYYTGGEFYETGEYAYDEEGHLTTIQYVDTLGYTMVYYYDKYENLVRYEFISSDGWFSETEYVYEYDDAGHVLRYDIYEDGVWDGYFVFEYDAYGNEIYYERYETDGTISYYVVSEYDEEGNQLYQTCYDSDGNWSSTCKYEYDADGNLLREEHEYFGSSSGIIYVYEYE